MQRLKFKFNNNVIKKIKKKHERLKIIVKFHIFFFKKKNKTK